MSQDIRTLFANLSKKSSKNASSKVDSRNSISFSNDDVDISMVETTPVKPQSKKTSRIKHKAYVISSDSEDDIKSKSPEKKKAKSSHSPKLTPVNIEDVFNKPIKQTQPEVIATEKKENVVKVTPKKPTKTNKNTKKNTELGIHANKDFEKTLMELDEDSDDTILLDNMEMLDKTIEEALLEGNKEGSTSVIKDQTHEDKLKEKFSKKQQRNGSENESTFNKEAILNEKLEEKREDSTSVIKDQIREDKLQEKTPKKRQRKKSENESTPNKKQKFEYTDSGIDADQERWEKKRHSAALYQQYLHRGGPKHQGEKEYPKGKPDCLANLTFLKTGVLDSLDSEEFEKIIKDHGGRVVHAVSRKVTYVVVGDQPGPSKLEKARNFNIKEISENELLDLILVKSGMKPKYVTRNDSEDLGLGGSETESPKFVTKTEAKNKIEKANKNEIKDKKSESDSNKPNLKKLKKVGTPEKEESASVAKCVDTEKDVKDKNSQSAHDKAKTEADKRDDLKKNVSQDSQHVKKESSQNDCDNAKTKQESAVSSKEVRQISEMSPTNMSWTEKYKPTSTKDIIGQKESNSNMNQLKRWLENWYRNRNPEIKKKLFKPTLYNQGTGEWFKAALLSGPPGVGKTTTATLVAKELGYDIVEFNASDTRSKKLLHEEISQMMQSKTVAGYVSGDNNINKKRILLMDEVDGMAGNEDRGGIAELINFIKTASFPIVCMCNNRDHQKMKTLVGYCFGLKFGKPNIQQVKAAMLSICFKEGIKIKPDTLSQLIVGTGGDIRQILNHLSMWSVDEKNLSSEMVEKESKNSRKDVVHGPWDVVRKVFTTAENKDMNIVDKSRLFFYDYSIGPLFVQENYLQAQPDCTGPQGKRDLEVLIRKSLTADSLSMADMVESKIRSTNNWSLLESQAFYTTVLPSHYMSGTLSKTNFPGWLGKNSQRTKSLRVISELCSHTRMSVSGDKMSLRLDYADSLKDLLIKPLKYKGMDGVKDTIDIMKSYYLLKDDLVSLCELMACFDQPNAFTSIDSKVKAALTRQYNKSMVLSFAPPAASKRQSMPTEDHYYGREELVEDSDQDECEDVFAGDNMVRARKNQAAKAQPATANPRNPRGKASSSRPNKASKTKGKK
ncbi:replication factor C subunit 1 [Sitophilus oryzae]|uniref:Replication factor C subunit 1 n=1 Tax=Sitophilus oryzae TaxID=7048 RepID=A0A6J2XUX9_SITOR|nr:replication factor C subunit 1 [Sitophilus oryzae]